MAVIPPVPWSVSSAFLMTVILNEIIIVLMLLIVIQILLVWWLVRKLVVVPTISVATDKDSYFRGGSVAISGSLVSNGNPVPNQSVALAIQPPTGDAYSLPGVTTDAEGNFTSSWTVPAEAAAGSYVLTATALGVSAAKAFTLIEPPTE